MESTSRWDKALSSTCRFNFDAGRSKNPKLHSECIMTHWEALQFTNCWELWLTHWSTRSQGLMNDRYVSFIRTTFKWSATVLPTSENELVAFHLEVVVLNWCVRRKYLGDDQVLHYNVVSVFNRLSLFISPIPFSRMRWLNLPGWLQQRGLLQMMKIGDEHICSLKCMTCWQFYAGGYKVDFLMDAGLSV